MSSHFDLLVKNGRCVTPNGVQELDLGVSQGKIVALGSLGGASATQTIDATSLLVLPGVIDSQVHFREPGLEHKEDLNTGTRSAAAGGVTTIFEMPNTVPNTDSQARLDEKLGLAAGRCFTNYAFFIGATAENASQLAQLERLPGCAGVKVFMGSSTGSLLVADQATLVRVLSSGTRRVAIHAEDEPRLIERKPLAEAGKPGTHHIWRDEETAICATKRALAAARETGRAIHILHVTTAQELELLAQNKDIATCELTPQHLTLFAPDCYDRLGTRAQMNPPIRELRHQNALWQAITQGVVDVIGSDHAPHTLEEKAKPYPQSPSGMTGVQTILPLMLTHVNQGRLSLERLVDLMCSGPARIYNLAGKGRIGRGFDADLTLIDMKAQHEFTDSEMHSRVGWTPFAGFRATGMPRATIVNGQIAMRDGELLGAYGKACRFNDVPLAAR